MDVRLPLARDKGENFCDIGQHVAGATFSGPGRSRPVRRGYTSRVSLEAHEEAGGLLFPMRPVICAFTLGMAGGYAVAVMGWH
jgi:hypothetical protein